MGHFSCSGCKVDLCATSFIGFVYVVVCEKDGFYFSKYRDCSFVQGGRSAKMGPEVGLGGAERLLDYRLIRRRLS